MILVAERGHLHVVCAVQLPIVTRSYVTFSFLTTAGCALEVRLGIRHTTAHLGAPVAACCTPEASALSIIGSKPI